MTDSVFQLIETDFTTTEEIYRLALESILRWTQRPGLDWVQKTEAIARVAEVALAEGNR